VKVRRAAVAGAFYPARAVDLAALVDRLLGAALEAFGAARDVPTECPRALVAPHAGFAYSGPVAATAYARLHDHHPTRVVLLGPAHFVPLHGMAVPTVDAMATPLGRVPVDRAACRHLAQTFATVRGSDPPHQQEHSLEVQMPFLQRVLTGDWEVVPIAVGSTAPEQVADVLDAVTDSGTLPVVSTDLSHGLDQLAAADRDRRTVEAVLAGDIEAVGDADACGAAALRGLMAWVDRHSDVTRLLDLRTSADATGDPDRVVGYGALAVEESGR
jgi:AmmeMemoRadiSam system protein B